MEHPDITKMNRDGFLGNASEQDIIGNCKSCDATLREGSTVVEFYDKLFCDTDCLTEKFCDNPFNFGAEKYEA